MISSWNMVPGRWKMSKQETCVNVFALFMLLNSIPAILSDFVSDVEFVTTNGTVLETSSNTKPFVKCEQRKELLTNYSMASSAFIQCAVFHAKPVLFCENCVPEFHRAVKDWDEINDDEKCKDDILISDKLQIVSQTHGFLIGLWKDGSCQQCYDENDDFRPKNSTKEFMSKFNATMDCFANNGGGPVLPHGNKTLCTNCSKAYQSLREYYDDLKDDQLCMDLIDLMNRTYMQWNYNNCTLPEKAYATAVTLSIFVCVLPVFFYLAAWLHGSKKQQRLVQSIEQTRTHETASSRLFAGTTETLR